MLKRAYSLFTVKQIDEDERIIEGIATSPTPDRMDDIVEPEGAEFELPLPLLWQHNSRQPIGSVMRAKVTDEGIEVRAQLAKTDEPGTLKDRLDEAWQSIKLGLVRGLSIGFRALETSDIKGTFGIRFLRWEWLELSAVTIPANTDATIAVVKSLDSAARPAAPGTVVRLNQSRVGGTTKGLVSTVNIQDQIKSFEATRAAKSARLAAIQEAAINDGRSKSEDEQEEFDTLRDEIKSIDRELVDLRDMEKFAGAAAKPVDATPTSKAGSASRDLVVRTPEKLEPGIEFARFAMCVAAAKGDVPQALRLAQLHYPQQVRAINVLKAAAAGGSSTSKYIESRLVTRAAVAAGTTIDETWAGPLVEFNQFAGDFVEFLRPQTIVGRFGMAGIPSLRRVPFNVHIRGQTSGGVGYWVGEGKAKPVTKFDFNDTYHGWYKVAAISVITEDLIRFSDPAAEGLVRDGLRDALVERLDTTFIDPAAAAVAGVSPASITNGVTPIPSSGTDGDAVRADILALWAAAMAGNIPATSAVYITRPEIAMALGLMTNELGQPEFSGVNMDGGRLLGVPLITSNYVSAETFVLSFAQEIWLSDDGVVTVDASRETSLQMDDAPTQDSDTPTPSTMVSMFQTNSVALRGERFINWSKRRALAVAMLNGVEWGGTPAT